MKHIFFWNYLESILTDRTLFLTKCTQISQRQNLLFTQLLTFLLNLFTNDVFYLKRHLVNDLTNCCNSKLISFLMMWRSEEENVSSRKAKAATQLLQQLEYEWRIFAKSWEDFFFFDCVLRWQFLILRLISLPFGRSQHSPWCWWHKKKERPETFLD